MLTIRSLYKQFSLAGETVTAVDDVSIDAADGEWLTLLGPSGCGKTTTLRCVAGLETPDAGEITIGDTIVFSSKSDVVRPVHRRPISMVFQSYAVWPHLTVFDNVVFPLQAEGRGNKASNRDRVMRTLEMVGMADLADRPATKLSGGQQQRVALARAIVKGAHLLLLDEPLSNLDAKLRLEMREELRQIREQLQTTALYVTHDQEEALSLSDRIVLMHAGRIVEVGTPLELYLHPTESFTAQFIGSAETWPCESLSVEDGMAHAKTAEGVFKATAFPAKPREECVVMVRPEHIGLRDPAEVDGVGALSVPATVEQTTFSGKQFEYIVRTPQRRVSVHQPATSGWRVGDDVALVFPPQRCVVVNKTPGT